MMIRGLALVMLGSSLAFADDSRPGLVGSYTQYGERPQTSTTLRVDPVPALLLTVGESPVHHRAWISQITWVGTITIPTDGLYQFTSIVQNATAELSISIAEKQTVELRGTAFESEVRTIGERTTIPAGTYPIRISINEPRRNEPPFEFSRHPRHFAMRWSGPGFREEPVPASIFRHQPAQETSTVTGELRPLERGQFLIRESGCLACHRSAEGDLSAVQKGPDLSKIAERTNAGWVDAWLADPVNLRPHTNMPQLFAETATGKAERYAVTQYLMTLGNSRTTREPKTDTAAIRRGERLFLRTGCAACHANTPGGETRPRRDDDDPAPAYDPNRSILGMGSPTGPQSTYSLGAIGSKWTVDALTAYLIDPLATNPHGRMPKMGLTNADARDLALFLTATNDARIPSIPIKPDIKPGDLEIAKSIPGLDANDESKRWIAVGKAIFTSKGCVNCHANGERTQNRAVLNTVLERDTRPSIPFDQLGKTTNAGCLADRPNAEKSPRYSFSEADRSAIRAALASGIEKGSSAKTIAAESRYRLTRLMCLNCHDRDGEGGLGVSMVDRMKTLATADDADQLRPPTLTQVGHKATKSWLADVLLNGKRARPWQGLRMPQYGEENVGLLVHGLPAIDAAAAESSAAKPAFDASLVAAGRSLTGKEGYGCIACHDIAGITGGGTRGPDLALTTQRIRSDWFDRWMHNPQRIQPGTKMPQYFLNGQATNNVLSGNPDKQIAALKAYYDLGPGLPLPTGIEPPRGLTIAVTDKVELMRTFMPDDAGTRAIAVGFPGGVNMAFDPTRGKLAYVWTGPFLEMSPVWAGRGGRPAKLLGPKVWTAPSERHWVVGSPGETPDFTKLERTPEETPQGDSPTRFKGYSRDAQGKPTFTTEIDGMTIVESYAALSSDLAAGVKRSISVTVPDGKVGWFRPAAGASAAGSSDNRLLLTAPDGTLSLLIVTGGPTWEKAIDHARLKLPAGSTTLTLNHWFVPRNDQALIDALK